MALVTVGGVDAFDGVVRFPFCGAWTVDLEVDSSTALAGEVTLDAPGAQLRGFVRRGGVFVDRQQVTLIGGTGGLLKPVASKYYLDVPLSTPLGDLAREVGERVSTTIASSVLSARLARWVRPKGSAAFALTTLARAVGAVWRTLDDGSLWLGADSYTPTGAAYDVELDEPHAGRLTLFGEDFSLRAGDEWTDTLAGKAYRLREVEHCFSADEVRTYAQYATSLADALRAAIVRLGPDVDTLALHPATVVTQSEDGSTVDVRCENPRLASMTKLPLWLGAPGLRAWVPRGASVLVGFLGGDRSLPFATLWWKSEAEELRFKASRKVSFDTPDLVLGGESGGRAVACVGDAFTFSGISPTGPVTGSGTLGGPGAGRVRVK